MGYGSVSKPCTPVVHIKIAGKWMFIPLKMVLIGIDPYPYHRIPSGKRLHSYRKSQFLMGKSTISVAIFNSYVKLPEGITKTGNWWILSTQRRPAGPCWLRLCSGGALVRGTYGITEEPCWV